MKIKNKLRRSVGYLLIAIIAIPLTLLLVDSIYKFSYDFITRNEVIHGSDCIAERTFTNPISGEVKINSFVNAGEHHELIMLEGKSCSDFKKEVEESYLKNDFFQFTLGAIASIVIVGRTAFVAIIFLIGAISCYIVEPIRDWIDRGRRYKLIEVEVPDDPRT